MRSRRVPFLPEWLRAAVWLQVECVYKLPGQLVNIHALTEKVSMRLSVWGSWGFQGDAEVFLEGANASVLGTLLSTKFQCCFFF